MCIFSFSLYGDPRCPEELHHKIYKLSTRISLCETEPNLYDKPHTPNAGVIVVSSLRGRSTPSKNKLTASFSYLFQCLI